MQLAPGTVIDRYIIEGELGRGGMAVVYRARHAQLGTGHAIKVLSVPLPAVRERLVLEGRVQAHLRHPNIVAVSDIVDVDGSPGLVMELIDGWPLDRVLANRALTPAQADAIARGILSGMAEAHRRGLIHRDLKPANVMLERGLAGPTPKITDFGLAKVLGGDPSDGGPRTRTGVTMGTPNYMAPEQYRQTKDVDARADVFSLGALLYELVTGKRAFPQDHLLDVLEAARAERYEPLDVAAPGLEPACAAAITAALRADPERRPPDAGALLAAWISGRSASVVDAPSWGDLAGEAPAAGSLPSMSRDSTTLSLDPLPSLGPTLPPSEEVPPSAPPPVAPPLPPPSVQVAPKSDARRAIGAAFTLGVIAIIVLGPRIFPREDREGGDPEPVADVLPPVAPADAAVAEAVLKALVPGASNPDLIDLTARRIAAIGSGTAVTRTWTTRAAYAELATAIAAHDLPAVIVGIPYQGSQLDGSRVSPACAVGMWQFMPETALSAGLHVDGCHAVGALPCVVCDVDERLDAKRSTSAALGLLEQAWSTEGIATHPQRAALTVMSYDLGVGWVLERLKDTHGDWFADVATCAEDGCDDLSPEGALYLPGVVAHAAFAICMVGDGAGLPCDQLPIPSASARQLLAARTEPLMLGLLPTVAVGGDAASPAVVDLKLRAALDNLPNLRVVSLKPADTDAQALVEAEEAGVDRVLRPSVGAIGARTLLNLEQLDLNGGGSRTYTEGDDLAAATSRLDALLGDLFVKSTQGATRDEIHRIVKEHVREVKHCYETALATSPTLAGRLEVGWTITNSGRVRGAHVVDDTVKDNAFSQCVVTEVGDWLFPANTGGADISWPFVFRQQP